MRITGDSSFRSVFLKSLTVRWQSIEHVFLDMDGTLLDLRFDNRFWQEAVPRRYARRNRVSVADAKKLLESRFKAMEGRMEWYCLDHWSRELELDIAALKTEFSSRIAILPHASTFLEAVRHAGKSLVLVTNAHPKSVRLKLEKTGLGDFFDAIVCAHDLGRPKEEPPFWTRLQEIEPFDPNRTLLVDDSLPVLRSARCYGVQYLIAVKKPDSARQAMEIDGFPAMCDFRELMPVSAVSAAAP